MTKQDMPRSLGRYEIVRELGKGAMGVVYEGRDPVIGRRVAIKTTRRDVLESSGMADELMERFLREARAAGGVNHPNVITIYDAGEENGVAYMAMEYIDSGTLFDRLCDGARMSPDDAVNTGAAICEALAAAHEKGIVHRDVKPANIMLLPDGAVKVADFGIARVSDSKLTQEGVLVGTPQYMSPEQFMGLKVDGRSDLFSAAVIIYEMLTGEHPFPAHGVTAIMHQVIKVDPVAPREINVAVNDNLSAVIVKALQKSPNRRYQGGRQMAAALLEALKEHPDPAVLGLPSPANAGANAATVISPAAAETAVSSVRPEGNGPEPLARKPRPRRPLLSRRVVLISAGAIMAVAAGLALILSSLGAGKGYESVSVTVLFPKDMAAYEMAESGPPYGEHCVEGKADIVIEDETGQSLLEEFGDTAYLPLNPPLSVVAITVRREGYDLYRKSFIAEPGVTALIEDVILKPVQP